jgi:hypothetical protein
MVTDPPNRHYGAVLTALLQERNRYHRPTWIYTPNPIASATFQGLYGAAFAAVLETPELQLLHANQRRRGIRVAANNPVAQRLTFHATGLRGPPMAMARMRRVSLASAVRAAATEGQVDNSAMSMS